MKITKLKIKNMFGITEYSSGADSVELSGANGTGKTSVIDAIRYALKNKSERDYVIREGATEGEVIIETDTALSIIRRPRTGKTDYKSIKRDGAEIPGPEKYLSEIFTELQLNPIEFLSMSKTDQNRIILDMIEFDWDMDWIKKQFGEIPPEVDWDQNILSILAQIQAENGFYFRKRTELNRESRHKKDHIAEIGAKIPAKYQVDHWKAADLSALYRNIETIRRRNNEITEAKRAIETSENKLRSFTADLEIEKAAIEKASAFEKETTRDEIARLEAALKEKKDRMLAITKEKADKIKIAELEHKARIAEFDAKIQELSVIAKKEIQEIDELTKEAETVERMKAHINEYERMIDLQKLVENLDLESQELTKKIEKARTLPGEILESANIPIKGLTVKDNIPIINGLPISNLSTGEKLNLCVSISTRNQSNLNILLLDGVECLSKSNRDSLYKQLKDAGVQFIATRTDDSPDLTVTKI